MSNPLLTDVLLILGFWIMILLPCMIALRTEEQWREHEFRTSSEQLELLGN